ncbi:MAG: type IV pilus twitching motility protein PilT [Abditibacteriaceae bacterium]
MPQIDNFISKMNQGSFDRAVLRNDKPVLLFHDGEQTAGPVISGTQLHNFLQEILPEGLKGILKKDGNCIFQYKYTGHSYNVGLVHTGGNLELAIAPENTSLDDATKTTPTDAPAVAKPTGSGNKPIGNIDDLFHMMDKLEASDLHLSSNVKPMMRVQGRMITLDDYTRNQNESLKKMLFSITPKRNQEEWEATHDTDFAYEIPGLARFRCNLFSDRHGIGGVFRLIPTKVLTVQELGLPKAMIELCNLSKGLVVVTGPTGSGKSTTLAALVDYINKNRDDHLITIEDPVEFVHENIKCLINQREVHVHTDSFTRALRAALREDPDICLVGEMRDLETIEIAITTAETGHLVFGTLHTTTAPSTVDRIIDQFPTGQQAQIRVMLSESLKGVIAQTLLRTIDGKRVAAHEILLVPTAVSNLIREGKTFQLPSQMQIGKAMGMKTMNESILNFVREGRVAAFEGYVKATDKTTLLNLYQANNIPIDFEAKEEDA